MVAQVEHFSTYTHNANYFFAWATLFFVGFEVHKAAIRVRAGECQCAAILYRLRFGCWYFDMLDRMCNQPIEIGFHFQ